MYHVRVLCELSVNTVNYNGNIITEDTSLQAMVGITDTHKTFMATAVKGLRLPVTGL